jgi:hypothetical protein
MPKYKRLIVRIVKWLDEKEEASTHEIYEFANKKTNGIVMTALTNVLSKNKNFEKVRVEKMQNVGSFGGREVCIWKVRDSKVGQNDRP